MPEHHPAAASRDGPSGAVAVLLNPRPSAAARLGGKRLAELLMAAGCPDPVWIDAESAGGPAPAVRAAVEAGAQLVLAAGGDGTARAAAQGLWGSRAVLGIIPLGTANVLARNLGIPHEPEAAVRTALFGTERAIDVGATGQGIFLVAAGLGLDARMMAASATGARHRIGMLAYLVSGLRHLGDPSFEVTVRCDDGIPIRRRVAAAMVGNVPRLPLGIQLGRHALVDDGQMEVVLIHPRGPAGWPRVAAALLGTSDLGAVERLPARRVEIGTPALQPMELDGDAVAQSAHLVAEVQPGALRVRVPAARRPGETAGAG